MTLRLEAVIGRAHLSGRLPDSKYFSMEQFKLKPSGGGWSIVPCVGAVNQTLVEGSPLIGAREDMNGMV
jgi:hypothetical protein